MPMPRRTITIETPVTVKEVKEFADSLKTGSKISARLPFRVWSSTTNFTIHLRPVKVTVLAKYPHVVRTDLGVFAWNELLLGYYGWEIPEETEETDEEREELVIPNDKKGRISKKRAA